MNQSEMNRLFDTFFGRPTAVATVRGARVWMPVVDMYETKEVGLPKAEEVKPKAIKIDIL